MASAFESLQLTKLETLLTSYLDAIIALVAQPTEYRLDTGQGVQSVTRHDISKLQETYGLVYQQYIAVNQRVNGGGTISMVPPGNLPNWG